MTARPRAHVRGVIAARVMRGAEIASVGGVVLHDTQREAVRRARISLARFRGAMLADDVGTGKTFVALAIAAAYANTVVVAPAALSAMWAHAARRAGVTITFRSVESLSRGCTVAPGHDLVIIDESHHLRNRAAKRYTATLDLVREAHALLLSATPIHNNAAELDAQLAIFLGEDAADLDAETRSIAVVRTTAESHAGPRVVVHPPLSVPDVAHILDAIRALPSPIAAHDGGHAPELVRIGFLRAWCSSREAAAMMARRAWTRGSRIVDYLSAGIAPSKRDLRSWIGAGEDQLAFVGLLAQGRPAPIDASSARAYVDAASALWTSLLAQHWIDDERARHLSAIVAAHREVPVLACSQYAATIDALWARLRLMPGVAALTSRGGRIISGPIPREEVFARFAPEATGARSPHPRERINLLLATDLVSEGLNLQDAGVLVHVDLPWTAARLAQRVGRIARRGSPHATVHTYSLSPPRAAAELLALEQRIATKRRIADELVGGARRTARLLGTRQRHTAAAAPESFARIMQLLRPWVDDRADLGAFNVCGVAAPKPGWLALVGDGEHVRLVARIGRRSPTTAPAVVVSAVEWLVSSEEAWLPASWESAKHEAERWMSLQRGRQIAGAARRHAARSHSRALAVTMTAMSGARPHERAGVAAGAANRHGADARHASRPDALIALVVFCSREQISPPTCTPLRP
jgi:superfamily II DNA or RNA helicase